MVPASQASTDTDTEFGRAQSSASSAAIAATTMTIASGSAVCSPPRPTSGETATLVSALPVLKHVLELLQREAPSTTVA